MKERHPERKFGLLTALVALVALVALALLSGRIPRIPEAAAQPPNSITIIKDAVPDGPQDFHFATGTSGGTQCTPVAGFDLDDDTDPTLLISMTFPFTAGCDLYNSFREIGPPSGWVLSNISCTGATNSFVAIVGATVNPTNGFQPGDNQVNIDLASNDAVVCTFTNQQAGPPPTPTPTATACVQPPADMVAWWRLNEPDGASVVDDIAGSVNNQGTPMPGPLLGPPSNPQSIAGMVGGALLFDSGGQLAGPHLEVSDHPELNFGQGDFSIAAWVRVPQQLSSAWNHPIVDKLNYSSRTQGTGYALSVESAIVGFALLHFSIGSGGFLAEYWTGFPPIPFDTWTHVAVTARRTSGLPAVTFYINGNAASLGGTLPIVGSIDNTIPLLIGESRQPGKNQPAIAIDELQIFSRALKQPALQGIFDAGSAGKCKTAVTPTPTAQPPNSITIIKDAVPDGPQDFHFATRISGGTQCTPVAGFDLDDDTDPTLLNSITFPFTAGCDLSNSFREFVPPSGWVLSNISCTGATNSFVAIVGATANQTNGFEPGDNQVTIDLASNEAVVCTFTNSQVTTTPTPTPTATLTPRPPCLINISKETVPASNLGFTFNATWTTQPTPFTISPGNTFSAQVPCDHSYSVTETPMPGWTLTNIGCAVVGTGSFTTSVPTVRITVVHPGDIVNCQFTNTRTKECGDVNDDGRVNSIDATLMLQYIAGLIRDLPNRPSADVNGDGTINAIDVLLILQHSAGFDVNLRCAPVTTVDIGGKYYHPPAPPTNVGSYIFGLDNFGPATIATVTFNDPLPSGVTFVGVDPSSTPGWLCSPPGVTPVNCTFGPLPPGATVTFVFAVTVPSGGPSQNCATVTFDIVVNFQIGYPPGNHVTICTP